MSDERAEPGTEPEPEPKPESPLLGSAQASTATASRNRDGNPSGSAEGVSSGAHSELTSGRSTQARNVALRFHDTEGHLDALRVLLAQARREVCICGPELELDLYADPEVLAAIKRIVTSGRGATLRILINDARTLVGNDHPLITLVRRTPSISAVKICEPGVPTRSAWICTDTAGVLFRPQPGEPRGEVALADRGRNRALREEFVRRWTRGRWHPDLRTLTL